MHPSHGWPFLTSYTGELERDREFFVKKQPIEPDHGQAPGQFVSAP
jgi:hypothetical protein